MSSQKASLKNMPKKKRQELKSNCKISVVPSPNALLQARKLCHFIPDLEWCGIILYSEEGTIEDPENFVITIHEICPMDIGTKGGTSFDLSDEGIGFKNLVKFRQERFDLYANNYRQGFIHSHNTMDVFFSGTDYAELHDNADKFNYYLSVITNNANEWTAKIAQVVQTNINIEAKGSKGSYNPNTYAVDDEMLLITDCKVNLDFGTDDVFDELLSNILTDRAKRLAKRKTIGVNNNIKWFNAGYQGDLFGNKPKSSPKMGKKLVSDSIDLMLRGTLGQQSFDEPVFTLLGRMAPYTGEEHYEDVKSDLKESFYGTFDEFEQDLSVEGTIEEMIDELNSRVQYQKYSEEVIPVINFILDEIRKEHELQTTLPF